MKRYSKSKEKLQAWKARFKSQLVSYSYKFNPWLAQKIKEQIKVEAKVKFFQNHLADLTAAPDTDGRNSFPPQTTNEGLEIIKLARELLGASYDLSGENIICFLSSASGAAEVALSSCSHNLDSKRKILATNFGAFSERTVRLAVSLGLPLKIIKLPYGTAPLFENLVKEIDTHTHLITFTHLETGTAQELQPKELISKITDYCRRKKITQPIIAIDTTSSKGTINFQNYEEIPLVVYSGTLKTCGSPLMSFVAANDKALEKIISLRWEYHQKKYPLPYYFDLLREFSFQSPDKFFTLAANIINLSEDELKLKLKSLAYHVAPGKSYGRANFTQSVYPYFSLGQKLLQRYKEAAKIGHPKTKEKLQETAELLLKTQRNILTNFRNIGFQALNFQPYGTIPSQSSMLNAYVLPEGINGEELKEFLRFQKGVICGLGYNGAAPQDWEDNVHPRVKKAADILRLNNYQTMSNFSEALKQSERLLAGVSEFMQEKYAQRPFRKMLKENKKQALRQLKLEKKRIENNNV